MTVNEGPKAQRPGDPPGQDRGEVQPLHAPRPPPTSIPDYFIDKDPSTLVPRPRGCWWRFRQHRWRVVTDNTFGPTTFGGIYHRTIMERCDGCHEVRWTTTEMVKP